MRWSSCCISTCAGPRETRRSRQALPQQAGSARPRDSELDMVELTLDQMAIGGIYDQLGGGFHRYSTDDRWLVPHFEKMLYDNALLMPRLSATPTRRPASRSIASIVEETLDYVLREMTSPEGGFYRTQDADSEGEEGKFYVWTAAEVEAALGEEDGALFCAFYDVSEHGNFEHKNILHVDHSLAELRSSKASRSSGWSRRWREAARSCTRCAQSVSGRGWITKSSPAGTA